jgi:hypothetical protein
VIAPAAESVAAACGRRLVYARLRLFVALIYLACSRLQRKSTLRMSICLRPSPASLYIAMPSVHLQPRISSVCSNEGTDERTNERAVNPSSSGRRPTHRLLEPLYGTSTGAADEMRLSRFVADLLYMCRTAFKSRAAAAAAAASCYCIIGLRQQTKKTERK